MAREKIIAGITNGDINGIGYEIIIKTLLDNRIYDICTAVVYGSPKVAAYHRKAINVSNFNFNNIRTPAEANPKRPNLVNCLDDEVRVELGKSTEQGGRSAFQSLEAAVHDLKEGHIDVLVTAPIDKRNIQSENFNFPGHTEYLKDAFEEEDVLMLMVSENMRIGTVTGHMPLAEVSKRITIERIVSKLRILDKSLKVDFGIRRPRIAVLGLNPHAGDNQLLGTEEAEIIEPAVKQAFEEDIMAFGPYPADGFFGSDELSKYDAILSMYHDQGLIPFKALAFNSGVNYTAGLSAVRTSPAHGTAYNLAGTGNASADSFRAALYLGCDIFRNRQMYKEITTDALQPQNIDDQSENPDELPPDLNQNESEL